MAHVEEIVHNAIDKAGRSGDMSGEENLQFTRPRGARLVFEGDFDEGLAKGYRTVSDYFDWPELFQAYPELRDVEVRFEDLPEDVRGDFDPKTKTIRIAHAVVQAAVRRLGEGLA